MAEGGTGKAGNWKERCGDKLCSVETAVGKVRPGSRIVIGTGAGEPVFLMKALAETAKSALDTSLMHVFTVSVPPYAGEDFADRFRVNAFFIGDSIRPAVAEGRADYTPVFLSEIPSLFRSGRLKVDVALIQVTPPDEHGFLSLGVSVDITKSAAETAELVIAQVNPRMPRTHGASFLHVSQIDSLVEHENEILEVDWPAPDEVAERIGKNVARLVEDGATLQVGIGDVPDAVLRSLTDRHDLGVHTEMFSDGVVELVEAGVITNRRKTLHSGKIVASFCVGSRKLYEFVHNNPMIEMLPSDYTNDPFTIAKNDKMVAINSALEIDLTGQVCSDSLGQQFHSGIGGQLDFIRGAARSKGGRPIIALPSTAAGGTRSRIVPSLSTGAGVVTTRGDVHYVVTEWGVADLHGRTIRERAMALIDIAHPDFRNELLAAAKERKWVYLDQLPWVPGARYPERYERSAEFDGGLKVFFRPARPPDEQGIRDLFYGMSDLSRYYRFFATVQALPHAKAQEYVTVDYRQNMTIVGIFCEDEQEKVIAYGQYLLDQKANTAEVAFVVAEQHKSRGIGLYLLKMLGDVAREHGISGLVATVLTENHPMIRVFQKSGYQVQFTPEDGSYEVVMRFEPGEGRG